MNVVKYNYEGVSLDTQRILAYGEGWRNDNFYGSGIDDAFKIIDHEVFELGNTDILYTCRKIYGLKLDIRKKKESVYTVKMFLRSILGERKIYGMWFGTEKNVKKYYNGSEGMSCYSLHKMFGDVVVLSDLGPEGTLLVAAEPFIKII